MSAAILRSAICAIFDDEDCQLDTPRMKLAKEAAKVILDSSADCHHDGQDMFESFADKIVGTYQKLVPDPAIPKSKKAFDNKKRHLWSKFHSARISELRVLWKEYFQSSALDVKYLEDPLLCEYVNEKLFGMFVKTMYEVNEQQIVVADPTENDLNALRYAAGYVPWKLLQKYSKPTCTDPNRQDFIVCLSSLSQKGEGSVTSTYLEYTKRWLLAIDRGGLFHIHDEAYNMFYEIECLVKKFLTTLDGFEKDKQDAIAQIANNDSIQFYWSMIAVELDDIVGQQLLTEIIELWVTIRGFSIAGAFVEQYKQITKSCTKKSTGLRKQLKRRKLDMNNAAADDI